ncbi:MAG TPA: YchJ family metal-binding protein [Actinoplanes sp.]|nr:YchJ family metal-binding protein [Actinoplanes sp.]
MARRTARRPTASRAVTDSSPCPCGLPRTYAECCGPALRGHAPSTAEALMRSRFTAFVLDDAAYVLNTWHPRTRPREVEADSQLRWERLEVLESSGGGLFDAEGVVEFRAHYRDRGRPGDLHERSRFVRADGAWVYWGPILTDGSLSGI